ncbi:hypothetical protein J5N97_012059 [Dioscorea zingiberensis]|uniref:Histidine decarboxylase n=1 Tax=Dioscorea zingiberensis TaxID=325984 RepID=A0A9D5CQS5_9LILI|nr:hypothetical protein J5N97_012059 [Dioscorea zingiberensis]
MVGSVVDVSLMDPCEKVEALPREFDPKEISCPITSEANGVVEENGKREIVLGRNVHTMCFTIDEPEADDEITGEKEAYMASVLARYRKSLVERTKHHLAATFSINNLGDPFIIESNYGVHSRQFEVGVLDWFARLWELEKDEYWGYITNCGTEGNLHGILVGREVFPDGILYASKESHYSVFKAARMYRMECVKVGTLISGEIDCADFADKLQLNKDKPAIINVNIGTTVKGAVDDLDTVIKTLQENGFTDRFYIHCDGALFGLLLPFCQASGISAMLNELSSTVVFERPKDEEFIHRGSLLVRAILHISL